MQVKHTLYKKILTFGFVLIITSFPLLIILDVETDEVFKPALNLNSDKGVIYILFLVGISLVCTGIIFKAFTKD